MRVLAIDTSCDETSAAVVDGRRIMSNVVYSQTLAHQQWGGVVPSIAKRAHLERIDFVVEKALRNAKTKEVDLDAVAVTRGPGLAIALEVGIAKAKELARTYGKPLVSVNHMEGHIYSNFVQNANGKPERPYRFPYLALLVSGGHTELVLFTDHLTYEVIGRTVDDAAGEALDKAARLLGFAYPGGPAIERLAKQAGNVDTHKFPRPLANKQTLNFSFSGLKTSFLYAVRAMTEEQRVSQIDLLASSFQEAVFGHLLAKTSLAVKKTGIHRIVVGGGVAVNMRLRQLFRNSFGRENVQFPPFKSLNFDNAAMIGMVGALKAERGMFIPATDPLDRVPRLSLPAFVTYESDMRFMKKRVEQSDPVR
jgi:N6-L-threonylcarbamoyladenine synthase